MEPEYRQYFCFHSHLYRVQSKGEVLSAGIIGGYSHGHPVPYYLYHDWGSAGRTVQLDLVHLRRFLVYTGYKMFGSNEEEQFEPHNTKIYRFLKKYLPLAPTDGNGKYIIRVNGKPAYTTLFVVIVLLASIDLVFALDSIPAVMGISRDKLIIYTSNIFAVLGLRSLFFVLRGAVSQFEYLQQVIAIVLVFIGAKMLGEHFISEWIDKTAQVFISLGVIVACISGSIVYSIYRKK